MPSSAGTGLRRRLGPLSVGGWLGVAGGSLLLLWLYRRYEAQKAAAAAANPPLSGGTTIPAGGTTGAPTTQTPTTLAGWEQAAISAMTGPGYSATQAFNDIANWLSGNPVSPQGATELGNVIATLGLPPVGGTLGPITVASTSTSPPTAATPNPPSTSSSGSQSSGVSLNNPANQSPQQSTAPQPAQTNVLTGALSTLPVTNTVPAVETGIAYPVIQAFTQGNDLYGVINGRQVVVPGGASQYTTAAQQAAAIQATYQQLFAGNYNVLG